MDTGMYIVIICYLFVSTLCLLDIAGELKEIRNTLREWNRSGEES